MSPRLPLAIALAVAVAAGPAGAAATPTPTPPPPATARGTTFPGIHISPPGPLLLIRDIGDTPVLTQHQIPELDPRVASRLQEARDLRESGRLGPARDSVQALLALVPHHPLLLAELARVESARGDWASVVRLAQAERAAQGDSLLLGRDLSAGLERLRRWREATEVALQCWIVMPAEGEWAFETVVRLVSSDARGVREALHRTAAARPNRVDLQAAEARLDWKLGDESGARKTLLAADRPGLTPPLRWRFADELLRTGSDRDSVGAAQALESMAADVRFDVSYRMQAARRAFDLHRARGTIRQGAPALHDALKDVPPARWNADLLLDVARGLREAGQTAPARALLGAMDKEASSPATIKLERALDDLRDGPPATSLAGLHAIAEQSDEARFRFAEALFFSGFPDSALAEYRRVSDNPESPFAGAALERMFLIEDARPKTALADVGRVMYLDWRGDAKGTLALADSLYHGLPHGPLWAQMALLLSARLDQAGQPQAAVEPLLQVAENLPDDRLAPVARQRAGDIYLFRLKQEAQALEQYEACLTRYPKAWNAAEVRRRLEALRKSRL